MAEWLLDTPVKDSKDRNCDIVRIKSMTDDQDNSIYEIVYCVGFMSGPDFVVGSEKKHVLKDQYAPDGAPGQTEVPVAGKQFYTAFKGSGIVFGDPEDTLILMAAAFVIGAGSIQ